MENENSEKFMQGLGVTEGTVANVTKESMLENMRNDVAAYEKALDNSKKELDNYKEQLEIDQKQWEILLKPGAIRKLVPIYVFEEDPEYWKLAQKKQEFKIREDRAIAEGTLKQLEDRVTSTEKALERAKEKLAKFEVQ